MLHLHQFHLPQLGRDRTIRIFLPPAYFLQPYRPFPVLYALDGQNLFERHTAFGGRHWRIPEAVGKMARPRQVIVVGIDNGGGARINEYAPHRRRMGGGEGDAFLYFLMETLKPFMDGHYRTQPGPETTGILGSSLGGLLAMYAGLRYGQVFGRVAAFSPALWFDPQVLQLAESHQGYKSRFYVAGSKTESRGMEMQLQRTYWAMKKGGFADDRLRVVARDQGRHNEAFWGREFPKMWRWLAA